MRLTWIRRLIAVAGLGAAVALTLPTTSPAGDPLPAAVAGALLEEDIATLQKGLAKKPDNTQINTYHGLAMLLALHGQSNAGGPDGAKMAGLRDQAIKIAEALNKKNFAAAKKAAEALRNPGSGSSAAVKLHETAEVDVGVIMAPFRNAPRGLNWEKDIKAQSKKVTDVKLVGSLAAHSALAAEYTVLLPVPEATGAKKKVWDDSVKDQSKLSQEIVAEAARGDKADRAKLQKLLVRLDGACTACHNDFK